MAPITTKLNVMAPVNHTFVCTLHAPPPTLPFGAQGFSDCGIAPPLAFIAAHKLRMKYAMLADRALPAFPLSGGGIVLSANNVDLYLVWQGAAWCRVPIHSAANSAYGWVVIVDAPMAIGVKMPPLLGCALSPERAPWNPWPVGEKRGKDSGDEEPAPNWMGRWGVEEIDRAIGVVKAHIAEQSAPPSLPSPPQPTLPPTSAVVAPPEECDDLPFDVPDDKSVLQTSPKVESPQLGLF